MLFDSLPLGTVRWKRRLRQVDPNDLSLHFDHGVEKGIDLIVAQMVLGAKFAHFLRM